MSKAVLLFLIVMMVLAIFGKLRVPGLKKNGKKKCPDCGRFLIGNGPCECKKKG